MFTDLVLQKQNVLLSYFAAAGLLITVITHVLENVAQNVTDQKISQMCLNSNAYTAFYSILILTFYVKRVSIDIVFKAICVQEFCAFIIFLSVPYTGLFKPVHTAFLLIAYGYNLMSHAYDLSHTKNDLRKNWFIIHILFIVLLGAVHLSNVQNHYYLFQLLVLSSYVLGTLL